MANPTDKTITINTGHNEVTKALLLKLNSENTWYTQINETTVVVKWPIKQSVMQLLNSESEKVIPPDRSMSVPYEHRNELYSQLKSKNINFKKLIYNNMEFIIWDKENTEEVNSLLEAIVIRKLENTNDN